MTYRSTISQLTKAGLAGGYQRSPTTVTSGKGDVWAEVEGARQAEDDEIAKKVEGSK